MRLAKLLDKALSPPSPRRHLGNVSPVLDSASTSPTLGSWRSAARISIASYVALTALMLGVALRLDHGVHVYTLDDAYTSLAMAKTWLQAHSIGVSPHQFAVASSSPLWTVLITAFVAAIGLHDWLPFALNLVCSALALIAFCWGLERMGSTHAAALGGARRQAAAAIVLPLVLNLPALTFCGLEHILHALLTLTFTVSLFCEPASRARRPLAPSDEPRQRFAAALYIQAAVLPLVRLEAAFTVAAAALVSYRRGQVARAAWLVLCAGTPWLLLGGFMYWHGGFLLPNSIVAKAVPTSPGGFFEHKAVMIIGLLFDPLLVMLLGLAVYAWRRGAGAHADRLVYSRSSWGCTWRCRPSA